MTLAGSLPGNGSLAIRTNFTRQWLAQWPADRALADQHRACAIASRRGRLFQVLADKAHESARRRQGGALSLVGEPDLGDAALAQRIGKDRQPSRLDVAPHLARMGHRDRVGPGDDLEHAPAGRDGDRRHQAADQRIDR
jgi:hypothetical protein